MISNLAHYSVLKYLIPAPFKVQLNVNALSKKYFLVCFAVAPRTSLAGLQSTVTALPFTDYDTEVPVSLLSTPTH